MKNKLYAFGPYYILCRYEHNGEVWYVRELPGEDGVDWVRPVQRKSQAEK